MINQYDLVVVGGGILGTFHAYHALLLGKKVLQLEKDNFPVGATVRNFGMVVPSGMMGEWFEYGVRALEIYTSIQQEYDISVRTKGSVYIASDEDEQTLLHELRDHYDKLAYSQTLLSKSDVLKKYTGLKPSYVKEALFFDKEISVEPNLMIYRLHEYMKVKFKEFTLIYDAPVVGCSVVSNEAEVRTSQGKTFRAAKAVICNGYEFKLLFPEVFSSSGQVITKLQMMRTAKMGPVGLEGNVLTGLTIRRYESFATYCPSFKRIRKPDHYAELSSYGIHLLFKRATDGSIIIGDSHKYAEVVNADNLGFEIDAHINRLMLEEARRIVNFDLNQVASTWAGFYPQHPDKNILEYDLEDHIHIRTCIGGKGMTASPGYAEESIKRIFS